MKSTSSIQIHIVAVSAGDWDLLRSSVRLRHKAVRNAASPNEELVTCQTLCVNCGQHDHVDDSIFCPAYVEAKSIFKLAIIEGITVKEALLKLGTLYSHITKRSTTPRLATINPSSQDFPASVSPEISLIKAQIMQLQAEMRDMKERTIPAIVVNCQC